MDLDEVARLAQSRGLTLRLAPGGYALVALEERRRPRRGISLPDLVEELLHADSTGPQNVRSFLESFVA